MSQALSERLKYVTEKWHAEIDVVYQQYLKLCEEHKLEPIDFLNNVELYTDASYLGVGTITTAIEIEMQRIVPLPDLPPDFKLTPVAQKK